LAKLLGSLKPVDNLWSLTVLAMYTGARIEELCQLKTDDVDFGDGGRPIALHIREGKTQAARRRIPVHPVITPLVKRLVENADDNGYLIPDLLTTGDDHKRSVLVSKRFGYACGRAGLTDPALTFHSLRNTFAQRLENAGVPHETAKLLTGHKRQDMTYGVYSPGPNWDRLVDAVGKVTYGAAEEIVKAIAPTVTIETRPRRRRRR
jgi:integrase